MNDDMADYPIYLGFDQNQPVGFVRINKKTADLLAGGFTLSPAIIKGGQMKGLTNFGVIEWRNMCSAFNEKSEIFTQEYLNDPKI